MYSILLLSEQQNSNLVNTAALGSYKCEVCARKMMKGAEGLE